MRCHLIGEADSAKIFIARLKTYLFAPSFGPSGCPQLLLLLTEVAAADRHQISAAFVFSVHPTSDSSDSYFSWFYSVAATGCLVCSGDCDSMPGLP